MKRLLFATATICAISLAGNAFAADAVMQTASASGAYNTQICPAIAAKVAAQGVNLVCKESAGSGQNWEDVRAGKVATGLGQTDISGLKLIEHPDAAEEMGAVGFIVPEAVFCVAKKGGRVPTANAWTVLNDSETPSNKYVVGLPSEQSGPSGTIAYLRKSFPNFAKNTEVRNQQSFKFDVEMGRLRTGQRDLVCIVNMPNPDDERIQTVVASDDLFFVSLDNPQLETLQINGRQAYKIMDAPVTGGFYGVGGKKVKTIHTGVTVYVNVDKIDDKVYKALIVALRDPELMPKGGFMAMVASYGNQALGSAKETYFHVKKQM